MWTTRSVFQSLQCRSFHRSLLCIRQYAIKSDDIEAEWDRMYQRGVPRTVQEMSAMMGETVDSPPDAKLLRVAIIGVPNSGKSTLINKLLGWRVCSVSSKVHTTKVNARAILNKGSTQLVFLDTPGLVSPTDVSKHRLERSLLVDAEKSILEADFLAVMHDMSNIYTQNELHHRVLRILALHPNIPSVLVLNKVDAMKSKRHLLEATRILTCGTVNGLESHSSVQKTHKLNQEQLIAKALRNEQKEIRNLKVAENLSSSELLAGNAPYTEEDVIKGRVNLTEKQILEFIKNRKGWPKFQDVFMISALKGLGVDDLRDYLVSSASRSPWIFSSMMVTDQNPEEIALMTVREKFLDAFRNEIPYKIKFEIEHWDLSESELLNITIKVSCRRKGLARFVIGARGSHISDVANSAEQELRNTFRTEVRLRVNVMYDSSLKKQKYS